MQLLEPTERILAFAWNFVTVDLSNGEPLVGVTCVTKVVLMSQPFVHEWSVHRFALWTIQEETVRHLGHKFIFNCTPDDGCVCL